MQERGGSVVVTIAPNIGNGRVREAAAESIPEEPDSSPHHCNSELMWSNLYCARPNWVFSDGAAFLVTKHSGSMLCCESNTKLLVVWYTASTLFPWYSWHMIFVAVLWCLDKSIDCFHGPTQLEVGWKITVKTKLMVCKSCLGRKLPKLHVATQVLNSYKCHHNVLTVFKRSMSAGVAGQQVYLILKNTCHYVIPCNEYKTNFCRKRHT